AEGEVVAEALGENQVGELALHARGGAGQQGFAASVIQLQIAGGELVQQCCFNVRLDVVAEVARTGEYAERGLGTEAMLPAYHCRVRVFFAAIVETELAI